MNSPLHFPLRAPLLTSPCSGILWYTPINPIRRDVAPETDFRSFPEYLQPRMYSKLAVTGRRVLSSMEHPNRLIMWQKHEYTVRVAGSKKVRLLRHGSMLLAFFATAQRTNIWSIRWWSRSLSSTLTKRARLCGWSTSVAARTRLLGGAHSNYAG